MVKSSQLAKTIDFVLEPASLVVGAVEREVIAGCLSPLQGLSHHSRQLVERLLELALVHLSLLVLSRVDSLLPILGARLVLFGTLNLFDDSIELVQSHSIWDAFHRALLLRLNTMIQVDAYGGLIVSLLIGFGGLNPSLVRLFEHGILVRTRLVSFDRVLARGLNRPTEFELRQRFLFTLLSSSPKPLLELALQPSTLFEVVLAHLVVELVVDLPNLHFLLIQHLDQVLLRPLDGFKEPITIVDGLTVTPGLGRNAV